MHKNKKEPYNTQKKHRNIEEIESEKDCMQELPKSDIIKKIIRTKVLNIDINQITRAPINGVPTNLFQIIIHIPEITQVSHVDASPHGRILADLAPRAAHVLCAR